MLRFFSRIFAFFFFSFFPFFFIFIHTEGGDKLFRKEILRLWITVHSRRIILLFSCILHYRITIHFSITVTRRAKTIRVQPRYREDLLAIILPAHTFESDSYIGMTAFLVLKLHYHVLWKVGPSIEFTFRALNLLSNPRTKLFLRQNYFIFIHTIKIQNEIVLLQVYCKYTCFENK